MSFNKTLKPHRNFDPHKVVSEFATDFLAEAGKLVKVSVNDPDNDVFYTEQKVGADYADIFNDRWGTPKRVTLAGAGDPAGSILGITLEGTAEYDNHGNKILGFNERWAKDNGVVPSGRPAQIVTEGNFWIGVEAVNGTPAPGSGLVAGANGTFTVVDPSVAGYASSGLLVGKCLSTTGSRQGDFNFLLTL